MLLPLGMQALEQAASVINPGPHNPQFLGGLGSELFFTVDMKSNIFLTPYFIFIKISEVQILRSWYHNMMLQALRPKKAFLI